MRLIKILKKKRMQPQHQNLTPVEDFDWISKNHLKTTTIRKSQRQIKEST